MNKEIEKLEKEKLQLFQEIRNLEEVKGQKITRIAEIQGVIKYLSEKAKEVKKDGN